jgi:hypothetical protein
MHLMKPVFWSVLCVSLAASGAASAQSRDRITVQLERAEAALRASDIVLARDHYQRALELASARGDDRAAFARERWAALDARVPRLTVRLLVGAHRGATVMRDGVILGPGALGVPVPVLPGEHEVVVEAPQRVPRTFVVTLAEGEQKVLDVSPGAGAFRANGAGPNAAVGDEEDSEHTLDFSQRTVGVSLGGAGVGALGIGSIFGLVALTTTSDGAREEADNAARISAGFLIGGAIALAAGAIIYFTAASASR